MSSKKQRRLRSKPGEIPQILHFKPRNLAYILLPGKIKKYLGHFDGITVTPELEAERLRVWSEYVANQKLDPDAETAEQVTIAVLVDRYLEYARQHFVKNGRPTGSTERIIYTVRPLLKLYATLPASEFSPLKLKAVREVMIKSEKLCLKIINDRIGYIRTMFRWGVSNELVSESVYQALKTVAGLDPAHPEAVRTTKKVRFVQDKVSEAVLEFVTPAIGDMVRIQRLTGMRSGEVTSIRPCDIYKEGDAFPEDYEFIVTGIDGQGSALDGCWVYIPEEHKTEHHGKLRFVPLGPKAQEILIPYLMDRESGDQYVFSPAAEHRLRLAQRKAAREAAGRPAPREKRKTNPKRCPGEKYQVHSYWTAIQRAVAKYNEREKAEAARENRQPAFLKRWFPNQLRHTKGTEARALGGLETAQGTLGHANMKTTEIYAEIDARRAFSHAKKYG